MTPRATIYNVEVELSDNDRGVYESLKLTLAMHQSENLDYMLTRLLAYCREYCPGICFSKGLDDPDEPAIWARSLSGELTLWVEIGAPSVEKIHRASKTGARTAIYTHRNPKIALQNLVGKQIFQADKIPLYAFAPAFLNDLGSEMEKRSTLNLTISEKTIYLEINGRHLNCEIEEFSLS